VGGNRGSGQQPWNGRNYLPACAPLPHCWPLRLLSPSHHRAFSPSATAPALPCLLNGVADTGGREGQARAACACANAAGACARGGGGQHCALLPACRHHRLHLPPATCLALPLHRLCSACLHRRLGCAAHRLLLAWLEQGLGAAPRCACSLPPPATRRLLPHPARRSRYKKPPSASLPPSLPC